MVTPVDFGALAVAAIAGGSAYLSNRSAAKAATTNTIVGGRLDAEKDAYERARQFDLETIKRQDGELRELRNEVKELRVELARLSGRMDIDREERNRGTSGTGGTKQPGDN